MFSLLFSDFGDEEVNKLISHFRPLLMSAGVDVELIPDQWIILKTELYTAGFSQGTWRMFEKKISYCDLTLSVNILNKCLKSFQAL